MRVAVVLKAVLIAFVAAAVIGEEIAAEKGDAVKFDADVAKMLDILINSLYTDHKIFLRELISNASDALDKIRLLYLTNPKEPVNQFGEAPSMDIKIKLDKDERLIIMRDGGVGMTKEELAGNLGSLGSSGTKRFLERMKESTSEQNLIGQFGVGFYSVFLVAERVKVASKSDDSDKQYIWESTGDGTFFVYEDPRGNTLGRGTELTMELKKDADEYLEHDKIKDIVHRYSEFIHFPIYLHNVKEEKVAKPKEAAEPVSDDGDVKDEADAKDDEFEVVKKDVWELVNENKPIWTRKAADITEDEYNKFYKALTQDYDDPMFYTHFSVEGEVEFKAILFIPGRAPYNVFDTSVNQPNIRLYVRRVFITDDFKDLLPRYLNFVKGVVDSDDLPLNVSREVLQESRILKIIKKKLIRKALTMFADIAESDKRISKPGGETEEAAASDEDHAGKVLKEVTYPKLWEEFGKNLRLGLIEDGTNRARLTKLLRYKSSKSEDKLISLEDYVDRMPESQKSIYFITGESLDKIKQSPYLEDAVARDIEVIYMTDAIDEYVVGHVTDFSGKKLVNLAKVGVKATDSARDKKISQKRKEKYEPLTKWLKNLIGDSVTQVIITTRKTSDAFLLASPQHGATFRMNAIMKGQTLGEKSAENLRAVLEVNHLHPLVNELYNRIKVDEKDTIAQDMALALFDVAAVETGFEIKDAQAFSRRIGRMLRQSVDIASDAPLLEEDVTEYEIEEEEEAASAESGEKSTSEEVKEEVAGEQEL